MIVQEAGPYGIMWFREPQARKKCHPLDISWLFAQAGMLQQALKPLGVACS